MVSAYLSIVFLYTWFLVLFKVDDNTHAIVPICKRDGTPMGFFLIRGH